MLEEIANLSIRKKFVVVLMKQKLKNRGIHRKGESPCCDVSRHQGIKVRLLFV